MPVARVGGDATCIDVMMPRTRGSAPWTPKKNSAVAAGDDAFGGVGGGAPDRWVTFSSMTAAVAHHRRRPLLFGSLAGYRRRWLRSDLIAGLTVWAVLVPESLAYASIAGVSPVVGLYAAPPALRALRRLRQLPPSRGRADVGDGRAVRRGGRRPDHRWPGRRARLHQCAGDHDRPLRRRSRAAAARVPRQLHLRAGAQGLHHRPRPDDHHRPAPQAVRVRARRGQLLRAALGLPRQPRTTPTPGRWSSA